MGPNNKIMFSGVTVEKKKWDLTINASQLLNT